ncbi:MAG: glycosyltransferase, partial [Bacteroidota bacterium]
LEGSAHFLAERSDDYLPDETIHDLYRVADALILPSREEGFGIPVLEAGLAGIPAFCADIGPLREVGGPFLTYFSLDKAPRRIAGEVTERLEADMSFGLRQRVRSVYTWGRVYEDFISPILNEG